MSQTFRIMTTTLTTIQYIELEDWLKSYDLPMMQSKKFHRDFSDGTLFAKLLSYFYPKIVELNNYPARSSSNNKLINWSTLNRKILRKIELMQSDKTLKSLANAEPGVIEKLLYQLMKHEKQREEEERQRALEFNPSEFELIQNNEVMTINVNKKVGNGLVQMPQKMILYSLYENLRSELEEKDSLVTKLKKRIEHLEKRLILKDARIDELLKSLAGESIEKFVMDYSNGNLKRRSCNPVSSSPCIFSA